MTKKNNTRKKKGGSVASDSVNVFVPNFTDKPCVFNKSQPMPKNISSDFMRNNYGSVFKTQGGKQSFKQTKNSKRKNKDSKLFLGGNNQYDTFRYYPVSNSNHDTNTYPYYPSSHYNVPFNNNNIMRAGKQKYNKGGSRDPYMDAGDSNSLTGSMVPPTMSQNIQSVYNGETSIFTDNRSNVSFPSGLQLACDNINCSPSTTDNKSVNVAHQVSGNSNLNIPNTKGYSFDVNAPVTQETNYYLPVPRAGGGRKKSKKGGDSNGAASDFTNVLYSRGPSNYPDAGWHWHGEDAKQANYQQFRAFNKSSQYIPPSILSNGASQFTEAPLTLSPDPYMSNPYMTNKTIYGSNQFNGLSTKPFQGGKFNIKYKHVI